MKSLIEAMKKYPVELIEFEDYSKLKEKYPEFVSKTFIKDLDD